MTRIPRVATIRVTLPLLLLLLLLALPFLQPRSISASSAEMKANTAWMTVMVLLVSGLVAIASLRAVNIALKLTNAEKLLSVVVFQ